LCNCIKIFCSIYCAKQYAKITDGQQQGGSQAYKAHNEVLQQIILKRPSLPSLKQKPACIPEGTA